MFFQTSIRIPNPWIETTIFGKSGFPLVCSCRPELGVQAYLDDPDVEGQTTLAMCPASETGRMHNVLGQNTTQSVHVLFILLQYVYVLYLHAHCETVL